jgi:hypothetical protein
MDITCIKPVTRLSFYASNGHGLRKRDPVVIVLGSGNTQWQQANRVQEVIGDLVLLQYEMEQKPEPGAKVWKLERMSEVKSGY